MKRFNIIGVCDPVKHYMADISSKVARIRDMVDRGDYFTINKARQYGKTTNLWALSRALMGDYVVISITFEGIEEERFSEASEFCCIFLSRVCSALRAKGVDEDYITGWKEQDIKNLDQLGDVIPTTCYQWTWFLPH
jgi:hypothetical protein